MFLEFLVKNNVEDCLILPCRHSSLGKIHHCEKIYREGQRITCSFTLTKVKDSSFDQHNVQVMVKDNAGKIRPSFHIMPLTSHGKFSKSSMTAWIKVLMSFEQSIHIIETDFVFKILPEKKTMFIYLYLIFFKNASLEIILFSTYAHVFSLLTYEYIGTDNKQLVIEPRLEPRLSNS